MELTFVGGIGGSLGRAIVETYFSNYTKVPIEGQTFMPIGNVNILNSDSASKPGGSSAGSKPGSNSGSNSGSSAGSNMSSDPVNIFIKDVQNFTQIFMLSNQLSVDVLKEVNDTSHLFTLDHPQPF